MKPDWYRIFPDTDFRFRMGLRVVQDRSFFDAEPDQAERIIMRQRSLDTHPQRYAAALPESGEAIQEAAEWMQPSRIIQAGSALEGCVELGRTLDIDWVLLSSEASRGFPVIAGCVCFPSHWSLPAKLGLPIRQVHHPVPTLEGKLGDDIDTYLGRLQPGVGWERENWGLAPDGRLDRHPDIPGETLGLQVPLSSVWLRLERQYLTRLERTGAILFAIQVTTHRLEDLAKIPGLSPRIARALKTLPNDIARYKGLEACHHALVEQLEDE